MIKARFVLTTIIHNKRLGTCSFRPIGACTCIATFSKIGPKMSPKTGLCPHWYLEKGYLTVKNDTNHIYALVKYVNSVPVCFSFLGFDISAQKIVGWVPS